MYIVNVPEMNSAALELSFEILKPFAASRRLADATQDENRYKNATVNVSIKNSVKQALAVFEFIGVEDGVELYKFVEYVVKPTYFKCVSPVRVKHERGSERTTIEGMVIKFESNKVYLKGLHYDFQISLSDFETHNIRKNGLRN